MNIVNGAEFFICEILNRLEKCTLYYNEMVIFMLHALLWKL